MTDADLLARTAANYHRLLEPALFAPIAARVAETLQAGAGVRALDIGCGTGALARALADRAGPGTLITGLDANPGMLAVARADARITWVEGDATELPFEDGSFDLVASQFALMLIEDRPRALREAWRVLAPGGQLAVLVFAGPEENSAYARIADVYQEVTGPDIANALRFPFSMGDREALMALVAEAGITGAALTEIATSAQFAGAQELAEADILGWFPFAGLEISAEQTKRVVAGLEALFDDRAAPSGPIGFETRALMVTARKT